MLQTARLHAKICLRNAWGIWCDEEEVLVATCSVCNAPITLQQGSMFPTEALKLAVAMGFTPPEETLARAAAAGWSREQLLARWRQTMEGQPAASWLLCASCAARANAALNGPPSAQPAGPTAGRSPAPPPWSAAAPTSASARSAPSPSASPPPGSLPWEVEEASPPPLPAGEPSRPWETAPTPASPLAGKPATPARLSLSRPPLSGEREGTGRSNETPARYATGGSREHEEVADPSDPREFFSQAQAAAAAQAAAGADSSPGRGLLGRARPDLASPARPDRSRAVPKPEPKSRRLEPKPKPRPKAAAESPAEEPEHKSSRLPLVFALVIVVVGLIFGSRFLPQLFGPPAAPPDFSGVVFTLSDLPAGFEPLTAAGLKEFDLEPGRSAHEQEYYKSASVMLPAGFVSTDPARVERVFSYVLYPLTRSEQSRFDRDARTGTSAEIRELGGRYTNSSLVPELSHLGEASYGFTARNEPAGLRSYRVLIRRGSAVIFIAYVYEESQGPLMNVADLAKLLDSRLAAALAKPAGSVTITPTATRAPIRLPDLSTVVLTTTDLPGMLAVLPEQDQVRFSLTESDLNKLALFKYEQARGHQLSLFSNMDDEGWSQILISYLIYPLLPNEQSAFDNSTAATSLDFTAAFDDPGTTVTTTVVPGMEDLGEKALAIALSNPTAPAIRAVELQFRRGPVLVTVILLHLDGEDPVVDLHALGHLLDDRLIAAMSTYTPAPTPPPPPTETPTPTPTPAPTPTPLADFSSAGLALADLPQGFEPDSTDCSAGTDPTGYQFAQPHQAASFTFKDPYAFELICTYLFYPLKEEEQASFDEGISIANVGQVLASGGFNLEDAGPPSILSGMSDMGDKSIGIVVVGNSQGENLRLEVVLVRRGPVVEVFFVGYRQGGAPSVSMRQLIGIIDSRVYGALKAGVPE